MTDKELAEMFRSIAKGALEVARSPGSETLRILTLCIAIHEIALATANIYDNRVKDPSGGSNAD